MKLSFELDLHIPVEDILNDVLGQLDAAGYSLSRKELCPQNITLEEALHLNVGDVLHYEVVLPTEIPGSSSLDIIAVVTQRSIEKHAGDNEAVFQLLLRPDMILPYGPIAASVEERMALASDINARVCDVFLLDDQNRKHPEVHTEMLVSVLPERGTLLHFPPDYFDDLLEGIKDTDASFVEIYENQMAGFLDTDRIDENGIRLTVFQVVNAFGGGRAEIWLTTLK